MAKWHGEVAFAETVEVESGIWEERELKRIEYQGDVIRASAKYGPDNKVNDDVKVNVRISIVADEFARLNFHHIKYVKYMGVSWTVYDIEFLYPRMILTIGDVCTSEGSQT